MHKRIRILLVEDSPDDAALVLAELRRAGFETECKRVDEQEAFLAEIQNRPDIILCDYAMPRFDGLKAIQLLRQSGLRIPFILISGTVGEEVAVEAMKHGAFDYLLKDRLARLGSAVKRALEEKALRDERYLAEAALRESEEKFRQLAENINVVFWMTDPERSRILYVSPAYEKLWGATCQSLQESPSTWFESIHWEERDRVQAAARAKQHLGEYDETYRVVRPDGSVRWIHDRAFPVAGADGVVYRIVGTAEDVTREKETERQLLQSQKMEGIGQLAGGIAHDFNNMLMVIQVNLELLAAHYAAMPPECQDYLSEISETTSRAVALNRQLLTFSRKKAAQMRLLDLNDLSASFTKMLLRIVGEHISVKTVFTPQLAAVMADPGMMEQMLMNLCVNARDAMPNGGDLVLSTEVVEITPAQVRENLRFRPGPFVRLSVRDSGAGVSPENLPRIFEPFFTTKDVGKGSGLGLATVFGIVEQHDGWIDVSSKVGEGTVFFVYLPLCQEVLTESQPAQAQPAQGGLETILVVEDEPAVRHAVTKALKNFGYTVIEADSAATGQSAWNDHLGLVDLLITDMVMPGGLSGLNLIESLRATKPGLKAILMSGYSAEMARGDFVLPADVVALAKPFAIRTLAQTIRQSLDGK